MPTLNVDYAAIIQKADQRRETLQQIETLLDETNKHVDAILRANQHFKALNDLRARLDTEGRAMLGNFDQAIADAMANTARWLHEMQSTNTIKPRSSLSVLAAD